MKILFCYTNINGFHSDSYSFGLAYIMSVAREAGHEIKLVSILDKKNYLIQSFLLHLCVIFMLYYGFPNLFKYKTEFLPPLPIEIINISNKTAAPKVNFKKNKDEETKKNNFIIIF